VASLKGETSVSLFLYLNIAVTYSTMSFDKTPAATPDVNGARIAALEDAVKKLQAENEKLKKDLKSSSAKDVAAPAASADLEQKVRVLEYVLKAVEPNFDKLANKA